MKSISQFKLKKLVCCTEIEESKEPYFPQRAYASFLFKDRITNSFIKYKEVTQKRQSSLDLKKSLQKDSKGKEEFSHALRDYKLAKKFEMDCIRNKYLEKKSHQSIEKKAKNSPKSKEQLYFEQKAELKKNYESNFRKTIQEGEHKQRYIVGATKQKEQRKKEQLTLKMWKWKDTHKQKMTLGENGERIYQAALAHLKCEMKDRGEYLLNIPVLIKRKGLIKQQFKSNNSIKILADADKRQESQNKSPLKAVIESLQFSPFNKDQYQILCEKINLQENQDGKMQFMRLVRLGYLNQALNEAKKQLSVIQGTDKDGNNVFHLCVTSGDQTMCNSLLRALPFGVCFKLLHSKNKLGRTPLQKAELLRCKQIVKVFSEYLKENKISKDVTHH